MLAHLCFRDMVVFSINCFDLSSPMVSSPLSSKHLKGVHWQWKNLMNVVNGDSPLKMVAVLDFFGAWKTFLAAKIHLKDDSSVSSPFSSSSRH
ncbi:hypothetical protein L1887_12721 [Cichorium endivia]|nr:hypothetical protein L1887_12721 [Cichorium endivia]